MIEQPLQLNNIDHDELFDVIEKLASSFRVDLKHEDTTNINTFGDLCDFFQKRTAGTDANDCTSQQAFYKIRDAISKTVLTDKKMITPDTDLLMIFPRAIRRKKLAEVENILGFKTNLLRNRYWITNLSVLTVAGSIILLFIDWKVGITALVLNIIAGMIASSVANEMDLQTVRQLTEKLVRENYFHVRRNNETVNREEIPALTRAVFKNSLGLEETALTAKAGLW